MTSPDSLRDALAEAIRSQVDPRDPEGSALQAAYAVEDVLRAHRDETLTALEGVKFDQYDGVNGRTKQLWVFEEAQ